MPFYIPIPEDTIEDKSIVSEKERELFYGQSDHVRKYGNDYKKRLESTGLNVKVKKPNSFLRDSEIKRYSIMRSEDLYIISK